jgi:sugar phosphate isomerase/epimerase
MLTRRSFLKTSLCVASGALAPQLWSASPVPIGLQLSSVRKRAQADLPGVLAKIKAIGYSEVETYWNLYNHPAKDLRRMIADAGLRVPSGHFDYGKVPRSFEYAHDLGVQYMVCPMLPSDVQNGRLDGFKRAADTFNRWGEQASQAGFRFGFHNHNYEFRKQGGQTGYDVLLAQTDPRLVWFELDCYWVAEAGFDPVTMIRKLGPRVKLQHIKDRLPGVAVSRELNTAAEHFTEVGTGTLDFLAIGAAARQVGVEHYFVEQDEISKPVYESLATSYRNASRILSQ